MLIIHPAHRHFINSIYSKSLSSGNNMPHCQLRAKSLPIEGKITANWAKSLLIEGKITANSGQNHYQLGQNHCQLGAKSLPIGQNMDECIILSYGK